MGQREPRERDPAYLGWVAKLPCIACACHARQMRGVHVAHLRAGSLEHGKRSTGKAEKPHDRWTTPLCPIHHVNSNASQHHVGEEAFWEALHIDPFELCLALNAAFAAGKSGQAVIITFAAASARSRLA